MDSFTPGGHNIIPAMFLLLGPSLLTWAHTLLSHLFKHFHNSQLPPQRLLDFASPASIPPRLSHPKSPINLTHFRESFYDHMFTKKQDITGVSHLGLVSDHLFPPLPFCVLPESHGLQNLETIFPRRLARGFLLTLCQRENLQRGLKCRREVALPLSL